MTTVHRMRLRGELHPKRDAVGVYHYDPAEVIRAAAARGTPGRYTAGQIAAHAFRMFDQGGELKDIVMALQITPEEVFRLYRLWQCSLDDQPPARESPGARLLDEEPGAEEAFARAMARAAGLADLPVPKPRSDARWRSEAAPMSSQGSLPGNRGTPGTHETPPSITRIFHWNSSLGTGSDSPEFGDNRDGIGDSGLHRGRVHTCHVLLVPALSRVVSRGFPKTGDATSEPKSP